MDRVVVSAGDRVSIVWGLGLSACGIGCMALSQILWPRALFLAGVSALGLGLGMVGLYYADSKRIVVNRKGLRDNIGFIRWADVIEAQLTSIQGKPMLLLTLPADKYQATRRHPHDDGHSEEPETSWPVDLSASPLNGEQWHTVLRSWLGDRLVGEKT